MAIDRIQLNGPQTIDYVWATTTDFDEELAEKNAEILREPDWDAGTYFLAKFNNDLVSGNIKDSLGKGLVGWSIYRQKATGGYLEYVRTVSEGSNYLIDYNNVYGEEYFYYLFPSTEDTISEPFMSNKVKACWTEWCLLVCNNGDKAGEYAVDEQFLFQLNRSVGQLNNNADVSVFKTYGKYPKVIKGNSNYLSGQLSSFVGYLQSRDGGYFEKPDMMEKLQALSTDPRKKFLKDTKGNIWNVELSAPSTFNYEENMVGQPIQGAINWTEVGDTTGVSIYNGEMKTKWLLTTTGIPELNVEYIWVNEETWMDEEVWTSSIGSDD